MEAIALEGRRAIFSGDTYLRLNQAAEFGSGVHTPGGLTAGSINVGGIGGWGDPAFGDLAAVGPLRTNFITNDGHSWLRVRRSPLVVRPLGRRRVAAPVRLERPGRR